MHVKHKVEYQFINLPSIETFKLKMCTLNAGAVLTLKVSS